VLQQTQHCDYTDFVLLAPFLLRALVRYSLSMLERVVVQLTVRALVATHRAWEEQARRVFP
jgi:hydroxyacyl-ACP dehydratase HTD2-like protein with hotdog domain